MTDNHYSNGPVTDVTSPLMKCYETTTASATGTATVVAGSTVGFKADNTMGHPGQAVLSPDLLDERLRFGK